jgi:hypothetical protein
MEVEYVQTLKDHIAFSIYHQECQPWWRRHLQWWAGCLFICALGLGMTLWEGLGMTLWDSMGFLVAAIGVGLWTAHTLLDWRRGIANRVRKLAKRPENKRMLGWRSCTIGPEGVTLRTEETSLSVTWSGVLKIAQTEDYSFFYFTTQGAIVVPRRPFATEEDFLSFAQMARAYRKAARSGDAPDDQPSSARSAKPDTRITRESAEPGA